MRTSVNALIAVRCHVWDEGIAKIILQSLPMYSGVEFVILADETHSTINADFEKVSHTEDFSGFSLPNLPIERRLWYNGDYSLYALRKAKPEYEWYAVIDYDVVVTASVLYILEQVKKREIDFVAHQIREAREEWHWFHTHVNFDSAPWREFPPLIIISGRAIDHLLKARYEFFKKIDINQNPNAVLPIAEMFIPTALRSLPQYKYAELSEFVELVHYNYYQAVDIADPVCKIANTIVHPVLTGERLICKLIDNYGIASLFDANSPAIARLRFTDAHLIEHVIKNRLAQAQLTAKKRNRNTAYQVYAGLE